jgi:hypothetical protein
MEVLAGLSCISAPAAASVVAMCVNANKLAQSLTSQNPTKKTQRPNLKPHNNAHTHPHKQTNKHNTERKQAGERRTQLCFNKLLMNNAAATGTLENELL